ncbi:MAG: TonB-dependent receptor domain-containing protein, partial [Gemmatimonadota bacterium]
FLEQQFGLNDRLFFTAALRADDNSAFGKDFDVIYYPKASVSWMLSEEEFFPELEGFDRLRLRLSAGRSGLQPGSTAALQTLQANAITTPDDETTVGVRVDELGNALLEPEQSGEIEAGFDAGILEDRLGLELTYYYKQSEAALVNAPLPPSVGADPSRWINVGTVKNSGWETTLNAIVLNMPSVQFDLNVSGSWNDNELVELAEGVEPIGSAIRHQEGFPLGSRWEQPIEGWEDANGDGIITEDEVEVGDTAVYVGPSMSETQITVGGNVTLFERVGIYALFDHRGDFLVHNLTEEFRCRFNVCRGLNDRTAPLDEQARAVAAVVHPSQTPYGFMEEGDFWKLRELSLTYQVPSEWTSYFRSDRASVSLTARNLATWTDYTGLDPEVNSAGSSTNFGMQDFLTQPPIRTWTLRVNLGF